MVPKRGWKGKGSERVCKPLLGSKAKPSPPKQSFVKFKCQIWFEITKNFAKKCLDVSSRAQPPLHHCYFDHFNLLLSSFSASLVCYYEEIKLPRGRFCNNANLLIRCSYISAIQFYCYNTIVLRQYFVLLQLHYIAAILSCGSASLIYQYL